MAFLQKRPAKFQGSKPHPTHMSRDEPRKNPRFLRRFATFPCAPRVA